MTGTTALLHPTYWPEVRRGSERLIHDLGTTLVRRGTPTTLITSHPGRPSTSVEEGIRVVRVWRPPIAGVLAKRVLQEHVAHLPATYAALSFVSPRLVHAFAPTETIPALRWRARTARPVVLTFTGMPRRESMSNRWGRLGTYERAVRECDRVVVISEAARRGARRWLGIDPEVIYPGVDLDGFSPGGERAPAPTFLCPAAGADKRKRIDLLLEAFTQLRRDRPDARLVLQRRPGVALGVDGVEEVDLDDHRALLTAYRSAWATVLPSREEAFGLVLTESLACGTPVVGSDDAAAPEIVDSEAVGRLFDGTAAGLRRRMLETIELAEDRSTVAACRSRAEAFSAEACAAAHERLYRDLLGTR